MSEPLVLSLFPGIGLLDRAFEEAGFCVVRGPDLLCGGDIRKFHPPAGRFDGVIGGPPCQIFSRLRHVNPLAGQKHGNLIPEYERCVAESLPAWFLMENVTDAPEPAVDGYEVRSVLVRDFWVGGETQRTRRFSFGTRDGRALEIEWAPLHRANPEPAVTASGGSAQPDRLGGSGKPKRAALADARYGYRTTDYLTHALELQGLPPDFLAEAPFTVAGKIHARGNGVPLCMGRAIAAAVKRATEVPA